MSPPAALGALVKRFADGWTHHVTGPRTGTLEVSYYGDPRSDGTRPTLHRDAPVTSWMLKACHASTRRGLVALWVQRLDVAKPSWTLDEAVRGRHEGELVPQCLDAGQLGEYAASSSVDDYEQRLVQLEAKRAETNRKSAATRAARRAGVTELRPSAPTEILEEAA